MALVMKTGPASEPVTLAESKLHLRVESEDLSGAVSTEISIPPGEHVVAASFGLVGSAVEVSGYDALVNLVSGTNGEGGTVNVKLQESTDTLAWSDVPSGGFVQVTEENDNAVQELAYTRAYRYIRAVATVAVAACDFGVNVVKKAGPVIEDSLIGDLITAARQDCEAFHGRTWYTTTWELWLDRFPGQSTIDLPRPPLTSVTSIKYYGADNSENTFEGSNYFVDTKSEPGRVSLASGKSWPGAVLRPVNGVCITYVAGYSSTAAIPRSWRQALLLMLAHYYEHREAVFTGVNTSNEVPLGVKSLLWKDRVFQ